MIGVGGLKRLAGAWRSHAGRWALAGAAAALAACLLRPSWPVERDRFDHVVVLDITQSMDVQDEALEGKPASRLAFAKQALREALLQLPCGSKVGWGVFTEYRSLLLLEPVEVCANLAELRATLAHIDGRMAWSGNSEIAKGLHSGIDIARRLAGSPSLVFVTDGQEAPPLSPRHRPAFDDKPGEVPGVVVGVGGLQAAPIPKRAPDGRLLGYWKADEVAQSDVYGSGRDGGVKGERLVEDDAAAAGPSLGATPGAEHLSALREPYLRLLARERGFAFVRMDSPQSLVAALTAPALAKPTVVRADGRLVFAAVALLLLVAGRALPRRLRETLARAAPPRHPVDTARSARTRSALRLAVGAALLISAALAAPPARANDRPFQVARTAVLDDDEDEAGWSFESWVQRLGSVRGLSFEPEYTFGGGNSVQVELSRYVDRRGRDTGHEAEIELKHVFNNAAIDGWAWGVSAAVSTQRTRDADRSVTAIGLKLPVSIALSGGGYLHLNAGLDKASDARRAWVGAVGIERELLVRTSFFGELAREDGATFLQVGARHWLRREKLAVDFSLQQRRAGDGRGTGFILGVGWYGL